MTNRDGIRRAPALRRALAGLALGCAAAPALGQPTAEQCVARTGETPVSEAPMDLGEGFVAQHYFGEATDAVPDAFVLITECATGTRLIAAMPEIDGERRTAEEIIGLMREALALDEPVTGRRIAAALTRSGAPAQLRSAMTETCGCAAFYPDALGDKTPWSAED